MVVGPDAGLGEDVLPALEGGVCRELTQALLAEVAEVVTTTIGDHHLAPPAVCLLLVGRHPAAMSYARSTVGAARAAGVELRVEQLPETASNHGANRPTPIFACACLPRSHEFGAAPPDR